MTRTSLVFVLILCIPVWVWAQADDLEMGTPVRGTVYHKAGFALGFDEAHKQAAWVSYKLTADEVCNRAVDRRHFDFKVDPEIRASAAKSDYPDAQQFQRGHLAPAADMRWSRQSMKDCFYYSNMSPQRPAFNTGIWSKLEAVVRNMAVAMQSVYVITGPVLEDQLPPTFPGGQVSVPNYFYKVVLHRDEQSVTAIGFVMENNKTSFPVQHFAVSVDSVEHLTGLDFFAALPDSVEDRVEPYFNLNDWTFNTKNPCPTKKP